MRKTKKLISLLLAVLLAAVCVTGTAAFSASAKASTFTLEATSNAFPTKTSTYSDINTFADGNGDIYVTVDYDICADGKQLINFQMNRLEWDPTVLQYETSVNTVKVGRESRLNLHPLLIEQGFAAMTNIDCINNGYIISNFSNISRSAHAYAYNVDTDNNPLPGTIVRAIFKVIDPTVKKTTVNLDMYILSLDDEATDEPYPHYQVINHGEVNSEYASVSNIDTKLSPEGDVIDIIGDVNLDGNVDVLDAAYVQKYSSDKTTLNERQKYVGDVNNDGNVDVLDAADIQKYSTDKISEFKKK